MDFYTHLFGIAASYPSTQISQEILLMKTETQTLNSLVPLASFFSLGDTVDSPAAQPLDLSPKKPSYGYDDEDEDDGYDDEEEDHDDDDEDDDEDEDDDYDDDEEEEDYDDAEDEDEEEDDEEDDDEDEEEDEDEDIGYYTRPSGSF